MTNMTQDEKLDAILAILNEPKPEPPHETTESSLAAMRRESIQKAYNLMEALAKGPGFAIEQIKAFRAFNMPLNETGQDRPYIGLKEAKDLVLSIHAAKKVEY
jgi:hypothetical protein